MKKYLALTILLLLGQVSPKISNKLSQLEATIEYEAESLSELESSALTEYASSSKLNVINDN